MGITSQDLELLRPFLADPKRAAKYRKSLEERGGDALAFDRDLREAVTWGLPRNQQETFRSAYITEVGTGKLPGGPVVERRIETERTPQEIARREGAIEPKRNIVREARAGAEEVIEALGGERPKPKPVPQQIEVPENIGGAVEEDIRAAREQNASGITGIVSEALTEPNPWPSLSKIFVLPRPGLNRMIEQAATDEEKRKVREAYQTEANRRREEMETRWGGNPITSWIENKKKAQTAQARIQAGQGTAEDQKTVEEFQSVAQGGSAAANDVMTAAIIGLMGYGLYQQAMAPIRHNIASEKAIQQLEEQNLWLGESQGIRPEVSEAAYQARVAKTLETPVKGTGPVSRASEAARQAALKPPQTTPSATTGGRAGNLEILRNVAKYNLQAVRRGMPLITDVQTLQEAAGKMGEFAPPQAALQHVAKLPSLSLAEELITNWGALTGKAAPVMTVPATITQAGPQVVAAFNSSLISSALQALPLGQAVQAALEVAQKIPAVTTPTPSPQPSPARGEEVRVEKQPSLVATPEARQDLLNEFVLFPTKTMSYQEMTGRIGEQGFNSMVRAGLFEREGDQIKLTPKGHQLARQANRTIVEQQSEAGKTAAIDAETERNTAMGQTLADNRPQRVQTQEHARSVLEHARLRAAEVRQPQVTPPPTPPIKEGEPTAKEPWQMTTAKDLPSALLVRQRALSLGEGREAGILIDSNTGSVITFADSGSGRRMVPILAGRGRRKISPAFTVDLLDQVVEATSSYYQRHPEAYENVAEYHYHPVGGGPSEEDIAGFFSKGLDDHAERRIFGVVDDYYVWRFEMPREGTPERDALKGMVIRPWVAIPSYIEQMYTTSKSQGYREKYHDAYTKAAQKFGFTYNRIPIAAIESSSSTPGPPGRVQPSTGEESLARRAATEEAARLEAEGQATMFGGAVVKPGGPAVPGQPETRVQGAGTPGATAKAKAEEEAGQRNLLGGEAEARGGKLLNVRGTPEWLDRGPTPDRVSAKKYMKASGEVVAVPVSNKWSELDVLAKQMTLWNQDTGNSTLYFAADFRDAGKFNEAFGETHANDEFFIPAAQKIVKLFGDFVFMPQGDEVFGVQPGWMNAQEFLDRIAQLHTYLEGFMAQGQKSGLTVGIANSRAEATDMLDRAKRSNARGTVTYKPKTYSHLDTSKKLSTIIYKGGTYAIRRGARPDVDDRTRQDEIASVAQGANRGLEARGALPAGPRVLGEAGAGIRGGYREARGAVGGAPGTERPVTLPSKSADDIGHWLESQPAEASLKFTEFVDKALAAGEDIIVAFNNAFNMLTQGTATPKTILPEQAQTYVDNLSTEQYRLYNSIYNEHFDMGGTPEECRRIALEQVTGLKVQKVAPKVPPRFKRQPLRERIETLAETSFEIGGENLIYGVNRAARLFEELSGKKIYEALPEELASFENQLTAEIGRWVEFKQRFEELRKLADTPYGEETYGLSRLYRAMHALTGKTMDEVTIDDLTKGLNQLSRSIPVLGAIAGKAERIGIQKGDAEFILGRRRAFEWLKAEYQEYDDAALMPVVLLQDFYENMGASIIPEFGWGWQAELWYEAKKQFESGVENPAVMTFSEEKSVFPDIPPDIEATMSSEDVAKAYAQAVFDHLRKVAVRPFKPYERSTALAIPAELEAAQKADLRKARGGVRLYPAGEVFDRMGLGDIFYDGVLAKNDYFMTCNQGSTWLKRAWKDLRRAVGRKAANQFAEKGELHAILDGKASVEGYAEPYQKFVHELRDMENWLLEKVNSARATQGLEPLQLVKDYVLHTFNPIIQGMLDVKWVIPADVQMLFKQNWFKATERMKPGFEKHRIGRETGLIKNMKLVLPRMLEAKARYAALQPFLARVRPIIDKIEQTEARRYVEDWLKYQVMGMETIEEKYDKLMSLEFGRIGRFIGSMAGKLGGERGQIAAAGWMKDPIGKLTKFLAKLNYAAALPLNFRLYTYDIVMSVQNLLNGPQGFLKGLEASANPWAWKISREFLIPGRIPAEFIQHEITKSPLDWATEIGMKPDALIDIWRTHCSAAGALYQVLKDENPTMFTEIKERAKAKDYDFYHAAYEVISEKPIVFRPVLKRCLHRVATQQYIYDEINQPKLVQYPLGKPLLIFKTWFFNNIFRTLPEVVRVGFTKHDGQGFKVTWGRRSGALMWLLGMIALTIGLREIGVNFAQAWTPGGWQSKPAGPLLNALSALFNAVSTTMTDPERSKSAWLEFKKSLPIFMLYSIAYTRIGKFVTGREPRWWVLFLAPTKYAPKETWLGSFDNLKAEEEQEFVYTLSVKEVQALNKLLADYEQGKDVSWGRAERAQAANLGLKFVDYAKRLKREKAKAERAVGELLKQGKVEQASEMLYMLGYTDQANLNKLQSVGERYLSKRKQAELANRLHGVAEESVVAPGPEQAVDPVLLPFVQDPDRAEQYRQSLIDRGGDVAAFDRDLEEAQNYQQQTTQGGLP